MKVPPEYEGREQSFLKHRVLSEYLRAWAQKRASNVRYGKGVKLFYVDCFAGPWQSRDEQLGDTSVAIGLQALEEAVERWRDNGSVEVSALFVEKNPDAFARLEQHLAHRQGCVRCTALQGAFGDQVPAINAAIGDGDAFLFVDPTGWKGVAMDFIAPLARRRGRDVMINVMFNHINRFKDDPRAFLRAQMKEFFGLGESDIPPGLDERSLLDLYRFKLGERGELPHVASLAISHPTQDRTWFHLVVGGHHPAVLRLFRDVERKVCGGDAGEVRSEAKHRDEAQLQLGLELKQDDRRFERYREDDLVRVQALIAGRPSKSRCTFVELWSSLLAANHVTHGDVQRAVLEALRMGRLRLSGLDEAPRSIPDSQEVEWL